MRKLILVLMLAVLVGCGNEQPTEIPAGAGIPEWTPQAPVDAATLSLHDQLKLVKRGEWQKQHVLLRQILAKQGVEVPATTKTDAEIEAAYEQAFGVAAKATQGSGVAYSCPDLTEDWDTPYSPDELEYTKCTYPFNSVTFPPPGCFFSCLEKVISQPYSVVRFWVCIGQGTCEGMDFWGYNSDINESGCLSIVGSNAGGEYQRGVECP